MVTRQRLLKSSASGLSQSPRTSAGPRKPSLGLIYGMSPFGLARNLGIDRGSAQRYVQRYFGDIQGSKASGSRRA